MACRERILACIRFSRSKDVSTIETALAHGADDAIRMGHRARILDRSAHSIRIPSRKSSVGRHLAAGRIRFVLRWALEMGSRRPPRGVGMRADGSSIRSLRSCFVSWKVGGPVATGPGTFGSQPVRGRSSGRCGSTPSGGVDGGRFAWTVPHRNKCSAHLSSSRGGVECVSTARRMDCRR